MVTAKKKQKQKRYPGCLRSSRSDWYVLQRRCQPTPTPIYIPGTMFYSVGANRGQLLYAYVYIYLMRGVTTAGE